MKSGQGVFNYKNGETFEGWFDNDQRHGQGLHKYPNGDYYKGNFMRDKRHGYGIHFNASTHEIYDGSWRDDERNGEGVLILADGTERRGTWRGLSIIGKTATEKPPPKQGLQGIEKLYQWDKKSSNAKTVTKFLLNNV